MIASIIKNKIPKAAIKVKEFVKRLPSRCIKIFALRNSPNIKATIAKGIITISANMGIITIKCKELLPDSYEAIAQNNRNEQKKALNKKPFIIFRGSLNLR